MSNVVEGVWKNYQFKIATSKDFPKISKFLAEYYYKDEPITLMLGWTAKKARDVDTVVEDFLTDELSLYAIDIETNQVVAARIAYDSRRKVNLTKVFQSEDNLKVQALKDQLKELGAEHLAERYPEEVYAMGFLASVAESYRGQGLAWEIYFRSVNQFRQRGFPVARNYFSSKITMKIVRKLGYEELSRIYLRQLRFDGGRGKLVFPQADEDFYGTLMVIRLN